MESEELKRKGNEAFANDHFQSSVNYYTQAIESATAAPEAAVGNTQTTNNGVHVYYANRAFANIKLENYGSAIEDAIAALTAKPGYVKANYRRADAYLLLGKYKLAIKDFEVVCKATEDTTAQLKLKECRKLLKQEKFAQAICKGESKPISETTDINCIDVDSSYNGPVYSNTPDFMLQLFDFLKETPTNVLAKKYAYMMVMDMIKLLQKLPNMVDIEVGEKFTICGDIHGQFYDLMNIFEINGKPSPTNPYLFNGDFVDRGSFSVEVILSLFAAKLAYPEYVHMARGNHETQNMNRQYGFRGEVVAKYDERLYLLFSESFCQLPLAHRIQNSILVVHGGLFGDDNTTLEDLALLNRNREPPEDGIMTDLLWSDPQPINGRAPSKRGVACQFGPDVTFSFLERNNLNMIIRSHEVKDQGYHEEHDGKLITVFSAPNYCDQMGNKGAFIRLSARNLKPEFVQFDAVAHPPVAAMKYANPFFGM